MSILELKWEMKTKYEHQAKNDMFVCRGSPHKISMMKFVKALPKNVNCFKYLLSKCPHLSEAKPKEGTFVGPDIRRPMLDEDFLRTMTEIERGAWTAFKTTRP